MDIRSQIAQHLGNLLMQNIEIAAQASVQGARAQAAEAKIIELKARIAEIEPPKATPSPTLADPPLDSKTEGNV